jgi:hypothetical protein
MPLNLKDFEEMDLPLQCLYLDPSNYRLQEVEGEPITGDITAPTVQSLVFRRIKQEEGYKELKNSIIETNGLLERPIVVYIDDDKYLVLEGNRRVACLKEIKKDIEDGRLPKPEPDFVTKVPVLVLSKEADTPENRRLILSIRHVIGAKEWSPFQKSIVIHEYKAEGKTTREIAELLGTTPHEITRLHRAYNAFKQFCNETDSTDPSKFSYFIEAVAKPKIRNWLDIDDDGFSHKDERNDFYSWITAEEGEVLKIPMAIDVRKLPKILDDEEALNELYSTTGTIHSAWGLIEARRVDWLSKVKEAQRAIERITRRDLRDISEDRIAIITQLRDDLNQLLKDIKKIRRRSLT